MILSGQDIKRLGLLENADDNLMQTQGWDVRLDKVYQVVNKPFNQKIKEEDYIEHTPDVSWKDDESNTLHYYISPNTSVLFKLMETVNLSPVEDRGFELTKYDSYEYKVKTRLFDALVLPKSSLSRRGISVHSAWWDAGYRGSGVVLVRTSEVPLIIKRGDAFGQMIFLEGTPTDQHYHGQYQGEGLLR